MAPIHRSMHDELLMNNLHSIDESTFCDLLIKAINMHRIATTKYKDSLICKYHKKEYNIIRNDLIELGHVLALVVYTDLSDFCSAFRRTFRKLNKDEKREQVEKRHQQLYFYSRYLFEAIEFYGQRMSPSLKVHHGLKEVLYFSKFLAYFNQPISTTRDFTTAHEFSQSTGIILTLKNTKIDRDNPHRSVKFLSVSWLSAYPEEDEKLFYGLSVKFQIHNIREGSNLELSHHRELEIFTKFESLLDNFKVEWNESDQNGRQNITTLAQLIQYQQTGAITDMTKTIPMTTEYGRELFEYFCIHGNRSKIAIKNFESIPKQLYQALFSENQLSFIPIAKTFPHLSELVLTDLAMADFSVNVSQYIHSVGHFIDYGQDSKLDNIDKITFQSVKQFDRKQRSELEKWGAKLVGNASQWKIEYICTPDGDGCYHKMIISKYQHLKDEELIAFNKKTIATYSQDQIIQLIQSICEDSDDDKLYNNKAEFVSFIKQKNIDGSRFSKYERKSLQSDIANHFDNKKLKGPAGKLYTNIFKSLTNKVSTATMNAATKGVLSSNNTLQKMNHELVEDEKDGFGTIHNTIVQPLKIDGEHNLFMNKGHESDQNHKPSEIDDTNVTHVEIFSIKNGNLLDALESAKPNTVPQGKILGSDIEEKDIENEYSLNEELKKYKEENMRLKQVTRNVINLEFHIKFWMAKDVIHNIDAINLQNI